MDKETQHFIDQLKRISLTDNERNILRANLESYIDFHPLPAEAAASPRSWNPLSGWNTRHAFAIASFVLVITVGAGTCFAAESALPGDALYPIKINVNENVQTALAISPQQKAAVNATLAEARLQEAATLAAQQKLTPENSAALASNFEAHVTTSEAAASALESAGDTSAALDARSDLESRLVANAQVIQLVVGGQTAPEQAQASGFLGTVAAAAQSASEARMHSEAAVLASSTPSQHTIDASSQVALQQAVADVASSAASSSTPLLVQAQTSIQVADQALAQAKETHTAAGTAQAYLLSQHAKRTAAETSIFLQATKSLGIALGNIAADTGTSAKKTQAVTAAPASVHVMSAAFAGVPASVASSSESMSTIEVQTSSAVSAMPQSSASANTSDSSGGDDVNWSAALGGAVDTAPIPPAVPSL